MPNKKEGQRCLLLMGKWRTRMIGRLFGELCWGRWAGWCAVSCTGVQHSWLQW